MDKEYGEILKLAAQMRVKAEKVLKDAESKIDMSSLTEEQKAKLHEAKKQKAESDKKLNDLINRL